jgi:membrane protease subunit HflK
VITERRAEVQENTRVYLERLLDSYGTGIQVTDLRLQVSDAPDQVRDSFHEVVRAREDRERKINESQAYREDACRRRAARQQILQQALAYKEERIRLARGESDRFIAVLNEYRSAPQVTRERMYIETMERVFARVDKVLLSESMRSVLPFLPLRNGETSPAAARPAQPLPAAQPPAAQPQPATKPQPAAKP